jgi:exopolysaccharide biosynthesis polyprenyl glycosylphosphotransferase
MILKLFKKFGFKKLLILIGDFFILMIAVFFSLSFYYSSGTIQSESPLTNIILLIFYICVSGLILISFRYQNLYKERYYTSILNQFVPLLTSLLLGSLVLMSITFITKIEEFQENSRFHLFLFLLSSITLMFIYRFIIIKFIVSKNKSEAFLRRIIAIGAGVAGKQFAREIKNISQFLELVGFVDEDEKKIGKDIEGYKVLGKLDGLKELVENYDVDEIYITIKSITYDKLMNLIEKTKETRCQVNLISPHFGIVERSFDSKEYKNLKSVSLNSNISPFYKEFIKRIFDIVLSLLMLLVLFPFFLIFGFIIKISSVGPVFYKTQVIGKNGKIFVWYKFRTMKQDNDDAIHKNHLEKIIKENKPVAKIKDDKRITWIGKILRKFSIDELPQLINVLKGDMSLVGPRPCLPYEYEMMDKWHKRRTQVTPGMSGLWQIAGRNKSDVSFNDSLILDLYYVDNVSLWLDFKIIFKTIPVVIFGRGGK